MTTRPAKGFIHENDDIDSWMEEVQAAIHDQMGLEKEIEITVATGTEFKVQHNLGKKPKSVEILRGTLGATIYASRYEDWDTRRIFLKSTRGQEKVRIRLR
jgi:hypothetical protein